jgi:hypothetical protein
MISQKLDLVRTSETAIWIYDCNCSSSTASSKSEDNWRLGVFKLHGQRSGSEKGDLVVGFASKREDEDERWVERNKESSGSLDSTKRISRAVLNWEAPVVPSRRRSILELLSGWLVLITRRRKQTR